MKLRSFENQLPKTLNKMFVCALKGDYLEQNVKYVSVKNVRTLMLATQIVLSRSKAVFFVFCVVRGEIHNSNYQKD